MDFFAHIFWSIIMYGKFFSIPDLIQISFFSVLPDLIWGIPVFSIVISRILKGKHVPFTHERGEFAKKYSVIYNLAHSFVSMLILFAVFSVILGLPYYLFVLGWSLHLIMDLLVHKESYFKQKPLYPLSNFTVTGYFRQLTRRFIIANWTIITVLMIVLYIVF